MEKIFSACCFYPIASAAKVLQCIIRAGSGAWGRSRCSDFMVIWHMLALLQDSSLFSVLLLLCPLLLLNPVKMSSKDVILEQAMVD